ncbi:MAG: hypothetical protein LBW85_12585 [Deltaproteobacteria bacterium]|nr:hypothetical protein [Deltaproteobacteria bacterium]
MSASCRRAGGGGLQARHSGFASCNAEFKSRVMAQGFGRGADMDTYGASRLEPMIAARSPPQCRKPGGEDLSAAG